MFNAMIEVLKANPRKIVFTEGPDPRILEATDRLKKGGFLTPILIGEVEAVKAAAAAGNFDVEGVEIIDPATYPEMDAMVEKMVALRKGKMTAEDCRKALSKGNYFGTMLVKMGYADALLGGATYSTADTVRPALQLVKTKAGAHLVSSCFILVRGEEKLAMGDCAINIDYQDTVDKDGNVVVSAAQKLAEVEKLGKSFEMRQETEYRAALDTLRAQGVSKLIFDLRGNSGGFLDQAIAVANEFLHEGQLIVYTEDRRHEQLREYADGTGSAQEMEVAVLIDEASASSSEILAGALQDNDRGTIVGRRSFGKGLVQQQIPYADGSALRLTVARYYTPTGRSIQKPYTSGDAESYDADIWNRYQHNEFFSADSIRFDDALRRTTPGGKVVYGGGGIMPDIFVPLDTTDLTKYYLEVSGRNILYRYTIEYADAHRKALNAVRTTADLRALLDADRGLVDDFIRYAARKGVAPRYGDIARSRQLMEAQLKAYIGRNTSLEDSGYFLSIYPEDEVIVRAIGELEHPTIPTVKAAEAVAEGEPAEEQPAEEEPAEEAPHD